MVYDHGVGSEGGSSRESAVAAVGILHEPLDFRALGTIEAVAGDSAELIDIARSRLTRELTNEECMTFLHLPAGCPTG